MGSLRLVYVSDKYAKYLFKFDKKVPLNKNEKRPYLGVLLTVCNHKYYAPLTSPKPKFANMHNTDDFMRIDNGNLGAINFNNMIPVVDSAIIEIDFNKLSDFRYKLLLISQLRWLNENDINIIEKAQRLYEKFKQKKLHKSIYDRCVDFNLLEEKSKLYRC